MDLNTMWRRLMGYDPCVPLGQVRHENRDSFFRTSTNCLFHVIRKCSIHVCNCSAYGLRTLGDDLPQCNAAELDRCFENLFEMVLHTIDSEDFQKTTGCIMKNWNDCRQVCVEMSYEYTAMSSPMSQRSIDSIIETYNLGANETPAMLMVSFPTMSYTLVRVYKDDIINLISKTSRSTTLLFT
ncbi:uncharacterized protein LOC143025241 [Oratosquilla oratoria]|uniref:uncharacterized protein LOC143025241 n=1 Tax=Oratosquilla oratoria TaxID=337810 RepID=UPI003F75B531